MSATRPDFHQSIIDRIIAALDAGPGPWHRPWQGGATSGRPRNIASGKPYNGINVLALWAEAQLQEFPQAVWGTYRQWAAQGTDNGSQTRFIVQTTPVFNAAQVSGFDSVLTAPMRDSAAPRPDLDAFIARTGAAIRHGGASAYYSVPARRASAPAAERLYRLPRLPHTPHARARP